MSTYRLLVWEQFCSINTLAVSKGVVYGHYNITVSMGVLLVLTVLLILTIIDLCTCTCIHAVLLCSTTCIYMWYVVCVCT